MYLFITPPQDNKWEQLRNKEKRGHSRIGKIKKRQHNEQIKYNWLKHPHTHVNNLLNIN